MSGDDSRGDNSAEQSESIAFDALPPAIAARAAIGPKKRRPASQEPRPRKPVPPTMTAK